jgi:hypothetical protein
MQAQVFNIIDRAKEYEFLIADRGDFTLDGGDAYNASLILENPHITLYSLDAERQQAIFVETSPDINLNAAPFFYMAQFKPAVRVITVSYETLFQLAQKVSLDDSRLILIYSIGRSGTTVTSAAFECAEGVISLSEPDVFTQLVKMRDFSGINDAEISSLTAACMRITCKDFEPGQQPFWVMKFRSQVIELADLIYAHFPHAKSLFLYRNAEPWTTSMVRGFGGEEPPPPQFILGIWMWHLSLTSKISAYQITDMSEIKAGLFLGLFWLNNMELCLERLDAGQPILPVRYEDLKTNPLPVMEKLLEYCGVKTGSKSALESVFAKDSQAGTFIARDITQQRTREIDPEIMATVKHLIAEHPVIRTPDYRLPGTLTI